MSCPASPPPLSPPIPPSLFSLFLSLCLWSHLPESLHTDNRLMDGIVLVTVCDPLNGCTRWSLCSSRFYLEYLLDVSMTWCLWRVTGHSVARDTRDVSRITTDHHTRVRCISLMLLRFLWWCFHLFSPRMLLFFLIVFIDALLPLHGFWFFFFFFTQSFCAILVSVLFLFGWFGSFFCQQSVV